MKRGEMLPNSSLTKTEIKTLLSLLAKCEPGDLPREIFEAIAKVAVYPAIELAPLRQKAGSIEVLLFQREDDDPVWPNMMHIPGTVLRPTDETIDMAMERLIYDEIHGIEFKGPYFTGLGINDYIRGRGLGVEYWIEVTDADPADGKFYDVKQLPQNFISEQHSLLERAVRAFRDKKSLW